MRGTELEQLQRRIRACRKCVRAGYLPAARPVVAGKATDRVMIVGQAPGAVEFEAGTPFAGRSGVVLREWLARAGIDEAHLPYRSAITKCFPGKNPRGEGDRRPSPAEIALCAPWLEQELDLVRPRVLLLLGRLAIDRFWGSAPLREAVGRMRRQNGCVLIPMPHPSGASRWLNDATNRVLLERALRIVRREALM
ncbi:MAG: uracil-DNA glycosylase [Chloroflexi bacterium]|nr:MAG: uracil-DNA glycosylase [Chloroflexota bacterium]